MNDSQVRALWEELEKFNARLLTVERQLERIDTHFRARMKEEADQRQVWSLRHEAGK